MAEGTRKSIIDMYHAFHAAGVIHNDVDYRHWRIDGSGKPICIDFGISRFKETAKFESPDEPDRQWSKWASEEISAVKGQLGLPTWSW